MNTRLQLAQTLFGFDPGSPHTQIDRAERTLELAVSRRDDLQSKIDSLEDDGLYEWFDRGGLRQREIAKRTAKTIFVAAEYEGDRQKRLPRQPLESGAFVSHGSSWWGPEYALGATVRPKLEKLLENAEAQVEGQRRDLQYLHSQMAVGDLVLRPDELAMINDHLMALAAISGEQQESFSWREEGF